jgi:hypothetical protein
MPTPVGALVREPAARELGTRCEECLKPWASGLALAKPGGSSGTLLRLRTVTDNRLRQRLPDGRPAAG